MTGRRPQAKAARSSGEGHSAPVGLEEVSCGGQWRSETAPLGASRIHPSKNLGGSCGIVQRDEDHSQEYYKSFNAVNLYQFCTSILLYLFLFE